MPRLLGTLIGGAIGLGSEAYQHHKTEKAAKKALSTEAESRRGAQQQENGASTNYYEAPAGVPSGGPPSYEAATNTFGAHASYGALKNASEVSRLMRIR